MSMCDQAVLSANALQIPPVPKIVLLAIAALCPNGKTSFAVSIKKIADQALIPVRSVYRQLAWLEEKKLIGRQKQDGWKIENTFHLKFQNPQKTGYATVAHRCANLADHARARLETKNQIPPFANAHSPLPIGSYAHTPVFIDGSSVSLRNESPEGKSKKNGAPIMRKFTANGQADIFGGEKMGSTPKGTRWRECDEVPDDWLRGAAEKIEHETKFKRINLRAEAIKFENYWVAKTGKGANKINWRRTWINWSLSAAERAGHREKINFQQDHYFNDDDYVIGWKP